jgi:flagellar motor switch protein FliM
MERLATSSAHQERLPMLDVVFDRSVQMLTESFLHLLSTEVAVSLSDVQYGRFSECLGTKADDSVIAIVRAREWDATFLILMDSPLVFTLVELLLGGAPDPAHPRHAGDKRPTAIEMQLATRIMRIVAQRLSDAFATVAPVTFEVERLEMNPQFAAITRSTSAAIGSSLDMRIAGVAGSLRMAFPITCFESIKSQLQQMFMGERFGRDEAWEKHFRQSLLRTPLTLEAVLHQDSLPLDMVLSWRPGTMLCFDADAETDVRLQCDGEAFFAGPMGRKGSRIAAQIERILYRDDGLDADAPKQQEKAA